MNSRMPAVVLFAALAPAACCWIGCELEEPTPKAPPRGAGAAAGSRPAETSPAAQPTLPARAAAQAPTSAAMPIRLSAGVALPQTLPDGTAMSFSVDYRFDDFEPRSGQKYFWVFERARGAPARVPIQLKAAGNLITFVPWRPEEGPFQSHIEDARGNRLSDSIEMR